LEQVFEKGCVMTAAAGVKGLGEDELGTIREALAAGRKPKVMFTESAGQVAGKIGQVVGLTDPAESDEWIVVRFGRDELPFTPADLVIAPKVLPAKKAAEPEPEPVRQEPEFVMDKPVPAKPEVKPAATAAAPAPAPRKPAAAKAAKPKPGPGLSVALAYTDGEWTVAANQGAKALAKPYVIKPAEAMKMVALVDVPGVQEAVEQILAGERAEAQQQAERLRAELAEVEARIQELDEAIQELAGTV
jgi:hypothetical protein